MENQFAKLFNFPTGQLLVRLDFDDNNDLTHLVTASYSHGILAETLAKFPDAETALKVFSERKASAYNQQFAGLQKLLQRQGVSSSISFPDDGSPKALDNEISDDSQKVIPWKEAQALADNYGQDTIVVLLHNSQTGYETVLTWGASHVQSAYAAHAGEKLKLNIGWPTHDAITISSKTQGLLDKIKALEDAITKALTLLVAVKAPDKVYKQLVPINEALLEPSRKEHQL